MSNRDGEPIPGRVDLADLAFLLEKLAALAAYVDPDQRYSYINPAYESFFGYARQEILGRTIEEIAGREHQAIAEPHIRRALAGEPQTFLSWSSSHMRRPMTFKSRQGMLRSTRSYLLVSMSGGSTQRRMSI